MFKSIFDLTRKNTSTLKASSETQGKKENLTARKVFHHRYISYINHTRDSIKKLKCLLNINIVININMFIYLYIYHKTYLKLKTIVKTKRQKKLITKYYETTHNFVLFYLFFLTLNLIKF